MLNAIRKHTKSWIAKILAGLLVASFAVWGVNDMVSLATSTSSTVFEVGDTEVEIPEVENEIRREIARLRPVLGDQFGVDEARALGVIESVLQRQINDTALLMAAQGLGVAISDNLVREDIRKNPVFHSLGSFDRQRFQQVLNQNQFTENGFIALTHRQLGRQQLLSSFSAARAPKVMVDSLYRHRQEKRIAETVFISDQAQVDIPEPDRGTLEKFHKDNAVNFTAPEYRSLSVIRLEAAELAKEISVTNKELREAYEAREEEFVTPETRQIQQMIVADQTTGERARKALSQGQVFAAVAKEVAAMDADAIELGRVTRNGLPFPELAEAAFSLKEGETSAPVQSPLGWHIFRATGIEQGGTTGFDEVRDDLRQAVAHEKAIDGLFDLANRLEDSLEGGATLEDAASQLNLTTVKIAAVDKNGVNPSGHRIKSLPGGNFLGIAFATAETEDSPLTETGSDGYFVLRVDGVTPPMLKPLDNIRADVANAWKADRRAEKSKRSAESIVERVNVGTSFEVIVGEKRLSFKTSPAITRQPENNNSGLPRALIAKIFTIKPGKAVLARSEAGYMVARLKKIVPAEPAKDYEGLKSLSGRIGDSLAADILAQLAGALRDRFGVKVNRPTVDSLFTGVGSNPRPPR